MTAGVVGVPRSRRAWRRLTNGSSSTMSLPASAPNVFAPGANAFPQNAGYKPMGTVAAHSYSCADEIVKRYVKSPGPLVDA